MIILLAVTLELLDQTRRADTRFVAVGGTVQRVTEEGRIKVALLALYQQRLRAPRPITYEEQVAGSWGGASLRFERPLARRLDWRAIDQVRFSKLLQAHGAAAARADRFAADLAQSGTLLAALELPSGIEVLPSLAKDGIKFGAVFAGPRDRPAGSNRLDLATATPDAIRLLFGPDADSVLAARAKAKTAAELVPTDLSNDGRAVMDQFFSNDAGTLWRVSLAGRAPLLVTLDFAAKPFSPKISPDTLGQAQPQAQTQAQPSR